MTERAARGVAIPAVGVVRAVGEARGGEALRWRALRAADGPPAEAEAAAQLEAAVTRVLRRP